MNNSYFEYEIKITDDQLDFNGHLSNTEYVVWMQEVAYFHSVTNGMDVQDYLDLDAMFTIKSTCLKYSLPVFSGQTIIVKTKMEKVSKNKGLRSYKFVRKEDDKVVAFGESVFVYVDINTSKPKEFDQKTLDTFGITAAMRVERIIGYGDE